MKRNYLIVLVIFLLFWSTTVFASNQTVSGKTTTNIITEVRDILNESATSCTTCQYTDTELLRHLNNGLRHIIGLSGCSELVEETTLDSGASKYPIIANYVTINNVIYRSGITEYKALLRGRRIDVGSVTEEAPLYYYEDIASIGIYPQKDSSDTTTSGNTIYIYLTAMQSDIASGVTIPTPAAYDAALTYFIAWRAFLKENVQFAERYKAMYYEEMKFWTALLNQGRESIWGVIKEITQ